MNNDLIIERLTRPIIGIENRTAQEAFDIMADRIRHSVMQGGVGGLREALTATAGTIEGWRDEKDYAQ